MEAARLDELLARFPAQTVLVVGDFFLDKYLDLDPALSEPSLETGLDAYQVVGVRNYPGAAGTVVNTLRALDVKVAVVGVVGEDGEGDDLRRGLARLGVDTTALLTAHDRFTPTYLKPLMRAEGQPARELNRLDTKNRSVLPRSVEDQVIAGVQAQLPRVSGVVIADQVSEPNCGVITTHVRAALSDLARSAPAVHFLADSRAHVGLFRDVIVKPNAREAQRATGTATVAEAGPALRERTRRPVVVTDGELGMFLFDEQGEARVPGIPVTGPIDIVGAGDSALAGMAAALCAGATLAEAALVGNLAASITIQQLGVTGTATRAQVRARWAEFTRAPSAS